MHGQGSNPGSSGAAFQQGAHPSHAAQDNSHCDGESDNGSENDQGQDGMRQTGKRRSKNDNMGRDFKCKYCEKTYLSYPALYTHMK